MKLLIQSSLKLSAVLCLLLFVACARLQPAPLVQPGDSVRVKYTCRSPDGLLMATTEKAPAEDTGVAKSPVFEMPAAFEPVVLTAGPETVCSTCPKESMQLKGLDDALHASLAAAIVGRPYGRRLELLLNRQVPEGLPPGKRYLGLAKVWERPKQASMLVDDYYKMMGFDPVVGYQYPYEMGLQATVTAIKDNHVLIRYAPQVALGPSVPTAFGRGIIRDGGGQWRIDMQVSKGQLVRADGLVGQVVEVAPPMFYIDFGNAFGGRELSCDVRAEPAGP